MADITPRIICKLTVIAEVEPSLGSIDEFSALACSICNIRCVGSVGVAHDLNGGIRYAAKAGSLGVVLIYVVPCALDLYPTCGFKLAALASVLLTVDVRLVVSKNLLASAEYVMSTIAVVAVVSSNTLMDIVSAFVAKLVAVIIEARSVFS
jgi:hypothetical protein